MLKNFLKDNPIFQVLSFYRLFKKYVGNKIFIAFFFVVFAGISESFGILMVLPLLEFTNSTNQLVFSENVFGEGKVLSIFKEILFFFNPDGSLTKILIIIIFLFLLKGFFMFIALSYNVVLKGNLQKSLRLKISKSIFSTSLENYYRRNTGDLVNLAGEQVNRSVEAFQYFTQFFFQLVSASVYISLVFFLTWNFGIITLFFGFLIFLFFGKLNLWVKQLSTKTATESGLLLKSFIQMFQSFKYLVATNLLTKKKKLNFQSIKLLSKMNIKTGIIAAFNTAIHEPILVVLVVLIMYSQLIIFGESISILIVSILFFYRGLNAVLGIQGAFQKTLERIGSMKLLDEEIKDLSLNVDLDSGSFVPDLTKQTIEFQKVFFSYNNNNDVLKNINLEIKPFSSMAIIGASGSGKSTLVDLILLMHRPKYGRIKIGEIFSDKIDKKSFRDKIGYVCQDMVIFDDTIENNICIDKNINNNNPDFKKKLEYAAKLADISDFISSLPNKYNTMVGDRGVALSGGQKQRLMIARELFRDPNLLILDEATSALDEVTEKKIIENINSISYNITLIIITHRKSIIKNVDKTYLIKSGEIKKVNNFK